MNDCEALLAAVLAQPDDDMPRLVYADWCDENGQPERAEFIRLQCELASMKCDNPSSTLMLRTNGPPLRKIAETCGRCQACIRASLLKERGYAILSNGGYGGWWKFVGLPESDWWMFAGIRTINDIIYRRGFVSSFACTVKFWLAHADAITAQHPVRNVAFTTRIDWNCVNYDPVIFERGDEGARRLCRPMHPDDVDVALRTGIQVVLRHEWPTVKTWAMCQPEAFEHALDITTS